MAFFTGLDLGQASDFAALALTDQRPAAKPSTRRRWDYRVRFLSTWPLGTYYTYIAEDVRKLFTRRLTDGGTLEYSHLAPDYTGVGRPVVDLLRAARDPNNAESKPGVRASIRPILITGGDKATFDPVTNEFHVPKRELVSTLVALTQGNHIFVGPECDEKARDRLQKELAAFKTKISRKGKTEQFGTWADGQHDDIVLALMLAVWLGEKLGGANLKDMKVPDKGQSVVDQAPRGVFN
jgi:hypothetical protein